MTFFVNLKSLIDEYFPGPLKLKTITTDESQAEMTSINKTFNNSVAVQNCSWHKSLTFERNLDVFGVTAMKAALYSYTEHECLKYMSSVLFNYRHRIDELYKLIQKRDLAVTVVVRGGKRLTKAQEKELTFKWSYFKRDVSKKFINIVVVVVEEKTLEEVIVLLLLKISINFWGELKKNWTA